MTEAHDSSPSSTDVDIWRDTPARYLGYANELGESFRPIFPRFVIPSYIVSGLYVLADTRDKASRAHVSEMEKYGEDALKNNKELREKSELRVISSAVDTVVWQGLASVAIPGFTINRVVAMASYGLRKMGEKQKIPPAAKKWLPTAIGLAVIPLIVHPIDQGVDYLLDNSMRPYITKFIEEKEYSSK